MEQNPLLVEVMRSLGAAWRALRLYPADSPMTAQATERVCAAIEEYIQAEPSLKLDIMRGGFILRGFDDILTAPGIEDFTDALAAHGVGEIHFVAPPEGAEILALIEAAQKQPTELQTEGGFQKTLDRSSVNAVRVVPIVLAKIETPPEIPEEEADRFLAELAADASRLAVWLRSLLTADDEGLTEGIDTLANAAESLEAFGRTMGTAFLELETDDKDRLLEVAIDLEPIRHISVEMLSNLSTVELTAAIRGGRFGTNLIALSYALASLPVGDRRQELLQESAAALRSADVDEAGIAFLEHMVGLRRADAAEISLVETNGEYRSMFTASDVPQEQVEAVKDLAVARHRLDGEGVATVLRLLDIAEDFPAYSRVLDSLARSVPHLMEEGDPELAMSAAREIYERSVSVEKPWPELSGAFSDALDTVGGSRSMAALVTMSVSESPGVEYAGELVTLCGESAAHSLAGAAMDSESEDSMDFAEEVLGRRLPELLAPEVGSAEARHAAKLAEMFARTGGPQSMRALGELVVRPEDAVRAKTARGIGTGGGQAFPTFMPRLLRDPSPTVSRVAVSVLLESGAQSSVQMLADRLEEFEADEDLMLAREIIAALAGDGSPAAVAALEATADKGSFLRKGKYADLRQMAKDALDSMSGGES